MIRPHAKKGFSLVELIVTMTIIGIIAGVSAGIIVSLMQLFVYVPNQTRARQTAAQAMDAIIEGMGDIYGLRYATRITSCNGTTGIQYITGDPFEPAKQRKISFVSGSGGTGSKIQRSYTNIGQAGGSYAVTNEVIPYYAADPIIQESHTLHVYKANGSNWMSGTDKLDDIRRIDIMVTVTTGSGSFSSWQGSCKLLSGTDIKHFVDYGE